MTDTPTAPVAEVTDLSVAFGDRTVVSGVSFALAPGECVALVGESGSGKSVTARSLLGLNGPAAVTSAQALRVRGDDLLEVSERRWRRLRGRDVGYVLQDALVSLDPLRRVGAEIAEPMRAHRTAPRRERERRVLELLRRAGVPEPELRARQLPSHLSGGLRQRALIAAAIALEPPVLVADEPTTALDTTVQAQVLDLLGELRSAGTALLLISHDLAVVERLADRVLVMRAGRVVETGPAARVLGSPEHPYTRELVAAIPSAATRGRRLAGPARGTELAPRRVPAGADGERPEPLLSARGLVKRYRGPDGTTRTVLDGVDLDVAPGETVGIVGESGSGKSTTVALALGLLTPDAGTVTFAGRAWSAVPERDRRPLRPRFAAVPQDPLGSFDPRRTVRGLIDGALAVLPPERRTTGVVELLDDVGLPAAVADRHPSTLSGGQRQRVAIARALATRPDLIVLDEPVSALDVSIQAQILDLLGDLQAAHDTAYLFVSHDLGVVHHVSDRVLVMRAGEVVEQGAATEVFGAPRHPYTRALLDALPQPVVDRGAHA